MRALGTECSRDGAGIGLSLQNEEDANSTHLVLWKTVQSLRGLRFDCWPGRLIAVVASRQAAFKNLIYDIRDCSIRFEL